MSDEVEKNGTKDWRKDIKDAAALLNARGTNEALNSVYQKHKDAATREVDEAKRKADAAKAKVEKKKKEAAKAKFRRDQFVGPTSPDNPNPFDASVRARDEQLAQAVTGLAAAESAVLKATPAAELERQFQEELSSSDRSDSHLKKIRAKFTKRVGKAHDLSDQERARLLALFQIGTAPSPSASGPATLCARFVREDTEWIGEKYPSITADGSAIDDDESAINAMDHMLLIDNGVPTSETTLDHITFHPNKE